jgi:hypothetical protein
MFVPLRKEGIPRINVGGLEQGEREFNILEGRVSLLGVLAFQSASALIPIVSDVDISA